MRQIQKTLIPAAINVFVHVALIGTLSLFISSAFAANKTSTTAWNVYCNASKPSAARVYAIQAVSCLDEDVIWSLVDELCGKGIQAGIHSLKDRKGHLW
jgi:hypothetical protein